MRGHAVVIVALMSGLIAVSGCATTGRQAAPAEQGVEREVAPPPPGVEVLADWMTGWFSSIEQHEADPENYFDIHLRVCRIWRGREDGPWLYVEQAASTSLDRPYRQRVYNLIDRADGTIASVIHTLPGEALDFAGAWKKVDALSELTPDDLEERAGCAVILTWSGDGTFTGSTVEDFCKSTLRGASYATSEVTVGPMALISWDRGFDEDGQQVWGATEGGYIFKRMLR